MSGTKLKLGSLFDGISGFPLVGSWYGIEPVWSSEIEAAPIRIAERHFPNMKNYGDITKIHGDEIEPVDVLTGGSPCQDLSCAGKQFGIKMKCEECGTLVDFKETEETTICPNCGAELTFTRSGLFMEQMRIIGEMREKTNECYPKVVIWENVSGALSSNNGDDFFCVLREFCKLIGEKLPAFRPESWSTAGEILGNRGSVAWRLMDAQYWGVPQRRRRIFLVTDFTGQHAGEILFKPESLRRHLTPGTVPWKSSAVKTEKSIGIASRNQSGAEELTDKYGFDGYNSDITGSVSATLGTNCGASSGRNGVVEESVICVATQQANAEIMVDKCPTLTAANGTSGSNKPYVVLEKTEKPLAFEPGASSRLGGHVWEDVSGTLTSQMGDNQMSVVTDDTEKATVYGMCSLSSNSMKSNNPDSGIYETDVSKTLDTNGLNPSCNQGGNVVVEGPVYCIQGNCIDRADTAGCNGKGWKEDVSFTLTTVDRPAVAYEESESTLCVDQGGGKSACSVSEEVSPTLTCTHGGAPAVLCKNSQKVYGVGEGSSGNVRLLNDKTYCLTTGGGKLGQGFGCVLIEDETEDDKPYVAAFAHQQGGKMPSLPFGEEVSPTLLSSQTMAVLIENHPNDSRVKLSEDNICQTLTSRMGTGGGNVPLVLENPPEETVTAFGESGFSDYAENRISTLKASGGHNGGGSETLIVDNERKAEPICTDENRIQQIVIRPKSIVRRLTPLECERLQGFPDNWTEGESDAARYKALGNSVALPCVDYVMSGVADALDL